MTLSSRARVALGCVLVATAVVGDQGLGAQASPPTPSVSIRRLTSLTSRVVTGDFNGDGIVDLASTSATPTAPRLIVVALGRGDSTFNTPRSAGIDGNALAAGDFNEDGKLDLIASDDRDDAPLRLLPGNGDGTFAAPVKIGSAVVAGIPFALAADFNGDGNLDVAIGFVGKSDDNGVLIYQGYGDGTFSDVIARLHIGMAAFPSGGVVADLNNDGKPDVLVANRLAKSLSIFLNRGGFNFTASDRQMAWEANDVTAADVNGDGKLDVVVAESSSEDGGVSYTSGTAVVYLGNGDGTIAAFGHFNATGRGAWRVVTGDFNRDGRLDIATANRSAIAVADCGPLYKTWDGISILNGLGDGTFNPSGSVDFSIGNQQNVDDQRYRNAVTSLAVADVNGDHAADLVSDGVVFTNKPPDANWAPTVTLGPDQTFTGTRTAMLRAVADDVDQDVVRYTWDSSTGMAIPQVPNPCITVPGDGTFTFVVTAHDLQGHQTSATIHYTFTGGGGTRDTLVITAPQPGEIVPAGVPYTIRWTSPGGGDGEDLLFLLSTDGGATWTHISECDYSLVGAHKCTWNAPNPTTDQARISISTRNADVPAAGSSGVFAIHARPAGALPPGWTNSDFQPARGDATYDGSTFTVSGSGADIWGTADQFHYTWMSMSGDFEVNALVSSIQNVNAWTKAGVMIRETPSAGSRHASLFASPGKGLAFQRRTVDGGASVSTPGPLLKAPVWVRLTRQGNVIAAYYRKAIADPWTKIGDQTLSGIATNLMVGLAVSSHVANTAATATFSQVRLAPLAVWAGTPVGNVGAQYSTDGTVFNVIGRGNDFWGTADQGYYVWTPLDGDGTITARVLSIQNTNAWAKAGVMIRESLAANSRQVDMIVSPSKGVTMQYRSDPGGQTFSVTKSNWASGPIPGTAPGWVRLTRRNFSFAGEWSTDGMNWTRIGDTGQIGMQAKIYIGLAVTSHNVTVNATGVFDDVRIER